MATMQQFKPLKTCQLVLGQADFYGQEGWNLATNPPLNARDPDDQRVIDHQFEASSLQR
jgi:hypothetical protein